MIPKLVLADSNVALPPLPDVSDPEVEVWRDVDGRICAYGSTVDGEHWLHLPSVASFCFGRDAGNITAVGHPHARTTAILDAYRRIVLPMALQVLGREVLHGSAVRVRKGVAAFCAISGTGKSTVAYSLSQRGYPLWADDAVAFETGPQCISAAPLPFAMRLLPDAASYFGADHLTKSVGGDPHAAPPPVSAPVPLVSICLLARLSGPRDGQDVTIHQMAPAEAFPAVLAHAYCFGLHDVGRKRRMVQQYLDLTARVPVYDVRFRATGLERLSILVDKIERLLSRIG